MQLPTTTFEKNLLKIGYHHICGIDEVGRGCWAGPVVAAAVIIPSSVIASERGERGNHIAPQIANDVPSNPSFRVTRNRPPAVGRRNDNTIRHLEQSERSRPVRDFSGLPRNDMWSKIRDSKTLSKKQRETLDVFIKEHTAWAVGECSNTEIDSIGIAPATQLAMKRAVENLKQIPDYLLLDGREKVDLPIKQKAIIDGDALCISIAAASIIAKEYRDALMGQYDMQFPGYGFASHVGYGTKLHNSALANHGPCLLHRLSYKPVKAHIL